MSSHTQQTEQNQNWMHQPLAIVGMACRLPGGDDLQQFWQMLRNGQHGIGRFPETFFDRELYYSPEKGVRGKSYADVGGLIADRPLDWSIMPVPASEASHWDPCHLILAEVTAAACIHAGYDPRNMPDRRAGVYIGHSGGSTRGGEIAYHTLLTDYVDLLEDLPPWQSMSELERDDVRSQLLDRLRATRRARTPDGGPMVDAGCAAGLLSRAFGLSGPHMSIDAACASSLVALALSATALHTGQIDVAIVGGASYNKFDSLILFSQAQSCSPNSSRPFDAAADGLISSEGYVVFIMKTLAKAQADGDRIEAVIRGIGVSSDGRGRSLWAPRKEGQYTAIERAYAPDVTADSVQMVEAHATSTQVGDATEMDALSSFFRERLSPGKRIPVGSVKSNIGHTLETAGLAGVLKAVLSIQHKTIPPSINVQQLSHSIAWNDIPLYVPQTCMPWPELPPDQPRRAAVNAFGIGGLNVHVIVDQYLPAPTQPQSNQPTWPQGDVKSATRGTPQNRSTQTRSSQPGLQLPGQSTGQATRHTTPQLVAVIGRGMVVPGALDVQAFADLLQHGPVPLVVPPESRWRSARHRQRAADHLDVIGGYITDYHYDWRKHKVPPKQIAQANPLQFMLLEAAEQALREAGYLEKTWDRQRTAVVVGSVFGGDFSNALYAGLRLPEFKRQLTDLLKKRVPHLPPQVLAELQASYEELFLKRYPALLDETGSFTSSTLASRLSKTFDLMGGAMAIDAVEVSGLAALDAAVGLLRSGTVNQVLCATGQHALDRASLERMYLEGRLVDRAQYQAATEAERGRLAQSVPSEGVALLLLKRLDDAIADGDRVIATIHDITAGRLAHAASVTDVAGRLSLPIPVSQTAANQTISQQTIGNMFSAQGLVDVIETSLIGNVATDDASRIHLITQQTTLGLCYCAAVEPGLPSVSLTKAAPMMSEPVSNLALVSPENSEQKLLRLSATTAAGLVDSLQSLSSLTWPEVIEVAQRSGNAWVSSVGDSRGNETNANVENAWRSALVVGPADYASKAKMLAAQIGQPAANVPLAEQGMYWSAPNMRAKKVAWLLPGQGSQYQHMLRDLVLAEPSAVAALAECNAALAALGQPTFEQFAWNQASQLGADVWQTQAAMLISDYLLMSVLRAEGYAADVVAGHSFGEFAAMLAAGCWDIRTALTATWHRCRAIVDHVPAACGMLSIQAAADVVQQLIRTSHCQVSISHRNAPQQTVVGGQQAAVAQFAQIVDDEGLVSRLLAVPTAFHTPALTAAQLPLAQALQSIAIEPPRTPLLSSVHNRYVAEPADIRQGLVTQLVTPLDFVGLVERLMADGVELVVEVGPQQVLTRLVRQIAGSRLTVLSTDHPKRGAAFQWLSTRAGLDVMLAKPRTELIPRVVLESASAAGVSTTDTMTAQRMALSHSAPKIIETLHFDATAVRRERMRASASRDGKPNSVNQPSVAISAPVAVHFDASQTRRDRNRQSTQLPQHASPAPTPTSLRTPAQVSSPIVATSMTSQPVTNPPAAEQSEGRPALTRPGVSPSAASELDARKREQVIETFLIDFVVEQTGYPAEIIELDWDIEADLGIDSIKKAQLFGELREFFDLDALQNASPVAGEKPISFSLDRFKTLRDIVHLLVTLPGKGDWLDQQTRRTDLPADDYPANASTALPSSTTTVFPTEAATQSPIQSQVQSPIPAPVPVSALPSTVPVGLVSKSEPGDAALDGQPAVIAQSDSTAQPDRAAQMQQFLIDFVVEQTGYPPEIVEMDADLEADLGIDSIKKAQLFGELREMFTFPISATADNRFSLSDFPTLRSVLELLLSAQSTTPASLPASSADRPAAPEPSAALADTPAMPAMAANHPTAIKPSVVANPPQVTNTSVVANLAEAVPQLPSGRPSLAQQLTQHAQPTQHSQPAQHVQATHAPQFRSLVPMAISDEQASSPCCVPLAWLTSEQDGNAFEPGRGYNDAVFANLQAMVGRPQRSSDELRVHYNGQRDMVQTAISHLASATGAADVSLLALDSCMLAQATWQPMRTDETLVGSSAGARTAGSAGALRPIVQYHVPAWLVGSGGQPIAIHLHTDHRSPVPQLQLLTPGCVHASVLLTSHGHLLSAGCLSNTSVSQSIDVHAPLQLVTWLHAQNSPDVGLNQFEKSARQLRLVGDWWAMCVDLHTAQRVLVECRDGVVVIEKGWLPVGSSPDLSQGECCAALFLDADRGELLLQARQRPFPFNCTETRIPLGNLQSWAAPSTGDTPTRVPSASHDSTSHKSALHKSPFVESTIDKTETATPAVDSPAKTPASSLTKRYVLRMAPAPQRPVVGRRPVWSGAALIIGDNPIATQLEARLRSAKVPVTRWAGTEEPDALAKRFDELVTHQSVRHLFLTTPCDAEAISTLDSAAWQRRRNVGLMSTFWLCQRWHAHVCASGWVDDASLVAVTSLGGKFGTEGQVPSIEGGALTGLLKAILIECWVQGLRTFPIKVIDTCQQDSPAQIANNIWQELAVPSADIEVAYCQGERNVVRAIAKPVSAEESTSARLTPGGTWVCTGGARGITAQVVEQLGKTYGFKLHLLGTQPLPQINSNWRELDSSGLRELKAEVMTSARAAGKNPVHTWQDTEKALEIDSNLRRFRELGIEVHYHACDVSDREQVHTVLQRVREISGPIRGVLHGAGIGKDARFDRKQPEKVRQCIGAKVDGAWALIEATWQDPLEAFIGFGSISGRFGANGHADYSLANDMLCKLMDWLREARPEVHAIGFHWHAWDDFGMATKPDTRLALEMVDMQFMPAAEGVEHLMRELRSSSRESEVLITDDRYCRLFCTPQDHVDKADLPRIELPPATPLIVSSSDAASGSQKLHMVQMDPVQDPFLKEHRLDDRPLMPIVIGAELLLESARAHLGHSQSLKLRDVRAIQGLRFYGDAAQSVRLTTELRGDGLVECRLLSDFYARDGRLVQRDRLNLTGLVEVVDRPGDRLSSGTTHIELPYGVTWQRPVYPALGSKFYVGVPLQRLRGFVLTKEGIVGRITAPTLGELAGPSRDVRGWQLPSSAVDACLFVTGILAWQTVAPGSALPTGFGEIEIGRLPDAGEACEVHVRLRDASPGKAAFDFTLYGVDKSMLVNVRDYSVAWLMDSGSTSVSAATAATSVSG